MDIRVVAAGVLCVLSGLAQANGKEPILSPSEAEAIKRANLAPSHNDPLSIRVSPGDWGSADRDDIERLLQAVARELWVYFPKRSLNSILVVPTGRHPLTGYAKGPEGEYVVYLSAKGRQWSQYAYQFAHEFTHILSNYERNGQRSIQRNQWFDESLCEAASLFTLRRLGATWLKGENIPYPHWQPYGAALQIYARDLLAQSHRAPPARSHFADWYRVNAEALGKDPYQRERDELVAGMLLPVFEEYPETWVTISYLNLEDSDATGSFEQYLANWRRNTPEQHRPLVERIIDLLGFLPRGS